jgi:CRP-like cAMP-binding protein
MELRDLVTQVLRELDWPAQAAHELAASAHVITYVKGSWIFHAGEPADLLYVLLSGEAKIYYANAEGGRLLVDIVRPRQIFGYLQFPASDIGSVQKFSAEALSCCTVAVITRPRVEALVRTLPSEAIAKLVDHLSYSWSQLSERVLHYLTMDVRGRLTAAIEDLAARFGIADARGILIPLRLCHEDFGELIGASRPMVSKHLKELADARAFFKEGGRYVLARREALRARPRSAQAGIEERPTQKAGARPLRAVPLSVVGGKARATVRKVAH